MKILPELPFKIKWKIIFSGKLMHLVFLNLLTIIMLFAVAPKVDHSDSKYKEYDTIEAKGVVTSVTETTMFVNDEAAIKLCFEFYHEKELAQGYSFTFETKYLVGDTVSVEYLANNFEVSRIVGTKDAPFTVDIVGMLISPLLFCLALVIFVLYKKIKLIKLLKSGFKIFSTEFQQELKTPTLPLGKANPFYRFKYGYNIAGATYTKVLFISTDEYSAVRIRKSPVIVDAYNQSRSYVLEALPLDVRDYIVAECTLETRS